MAPPFVIDTLPGDPRRQAGNRHAKCFAARAGFEVAQRDRKRSARNSPSPISGYAALTQYGASNVTCAVNPS